MPGGPLARRPARVYGLLNRGSVNAPGVGRVSPRPPIAHLRRPEILGAAAEVIRERGLQNTRIADVAERVGTSAPAVLYYFESKSELLSEALVAAEEGFYAEFEAQLELRQR